MFSHVSCCQIVNEPPPLWEVPSNCNNFTAKVFRAGLQKDPERRVSTKELRRKTTKALRAGQESSEDVKRLTTVNRNLGFAALTFSVCSTVGGLSLRSITSACEKLFGGRNQTDDAPCSPSPADSAPAMYWVSPWRTAAVSEDSSDWKDGDSDAEPETGGWESQPKSLQDDPAADNRDWDSWSDSEVDMYVGEEECIRDYEGDWEEEGDEEEEEEWDSSVSTEYLQALRGLFPLLQKGQNSRGSEPELEYLRDGESESGSSFAARLASAGLLASCCHVSSPG